MGSVLVTSNQSMQESSNVEDYLTTMPAIHQPQTTGGTPVDPDLKYLQEKLLRDEWLKLMRYTQKKKKKKKKERDKSSSDEGTKDPLVKHQPDSQNCNPSPLLLKALTSPEKRPDDEEPLENGDFGVAPEAGSSVRSESTVPSLTSNPLIENGHSHSPCGTNKIGVRRNSDVKTYSKSAKKPDHIWSSVRKNSDSNLFTSESDSEGVFEDARETLTTTTSKSSTKGFSTADEYDFSDNDDFNDDKIDVASKTFSAFKNRLQRPKEPPIGGNLLPDKLTAPATISSDFEVEKASLDPDVVEVKVEKKQVKTYSASIRMSESSNGSIIYKGSSSTESSDSEDDLCPRGGKKDFKPADDGAPADVNVLHDEMECESIPNGLSETVAPGSNSTAVLEDEIVEHGVITPDVDETTGQSNELPQTKPCQPTSIKYKSNRYYKPEQSAILWEFYQKNQYPSKAEQVELAKKVGGIEIRRIIWWFTHRRRTDKKKGLTIVAQENTSQPANDEPDDADVSFSVGCLTSNTCSVCQFSAARRSKLLTHLKFKHGLETAICFKCKKIWRSLQIDAHFCVKKASPRKKKLQEEADVAGNELPPTEQNIEDEIENENFVPEKRTPSVTKINNKKMSNESENKISAAKSNPELGDKKPRISDLIEPKTNLAPKTPVKEALVDEVLEEDSGVAQEPVPLPQQPPEPQQQDDEESLPLRRLKKKKLAKVDDSRTPLNEDSKTARKSDDVKEETTKNVVVATKQALNDKLEAFEDDTSKTSLNDASAASKVDDISETPENETPSNKVCKKSENVVRRASKSEKILLPCGSGYKCRLCPYEGPNILRHFLAIHNWTAKKCRKCDQFWEKAIFDDHPCGSDQPDVSNGDLNDDENEVEEDGVSSDVGTDSEQELPAPIFRTPTKRDLKAPKTFYSSRYSELLSQFSPKKLTKDCPNLSDLLRSSRFHRNGKLELNYITPKQLEAVQEFMMGDRSSRVCIKLFIGTNTSQILQYVKELTLSYFWVQVANIAVDPTGCVVI